MEGKNVDRRRNRRDKEVLFEVAFKQETFFFVKIFFAILSMHALY